MLYIDIITLFPEYFEPLLGTSILGRAGKEGLVACRLVDLRKFAVDRHGTVDDYPYGGGPGMVIRPEPFFAAVEWCLEHRGAQAESTEKVKVVLLSARGELFNQRKAEKYSMAGRLILLCGHYKDVDERVALHLVHEELSIGDYILSGGEPAAAVVVDTVARLLPGAIGDFDSAVGDSFFDRSLGTPQYTRPREFRGHEVPVVLTSGDHEKIRKWRKQEAERITRERRPELLD
ncbi:MAG: tRNA (guanosine(37)-N1)-methyltransferase TrmD [Gemmatimonadota bacterium]|nr:tRNA (guanosine(37)-N1)-methyltransferase TrmD [Gemmatimonadota bacterium]